jgi:hypothetical protein
MALEDTVWREDVIDQEEVARDSAKVLDEWIQRLAYQGAPPALLQRLTETRDLYSQVYANLQSVKQCFPSPHQKHYG